MEVKCADSPRSTGRGITRVRLLDTSLTLTDESLLTVRVNDTLGLTPGDSVGVGDEAGLTSADGVTRPRYRALRPGATGRRVTRIGLHNTSLVLTDVALLTIRISHALRLTPGDSVGVGDEPGLTSADGVTIPSHRALGPGSTGVWIAGVRLDDTSLALADVSLLTVRVYDALRAAAGDGVGLGHQAGLTPADGVTWGYIVHFYKLSTSTM